MKAVEEQTRALWSKTDSLDEPIHWPEIPSERNWSTEQFWVAPDNNTSFATVVELIKAPYANDPSVAVKGLKARYLWGLYQRFSPDEKSVEARPNYVAILSRFAREGLLPERSAPERTSPGDLSRPQAKPSARAQLIAFVEQAPYEQDWDRQLQLSLLRMPETKDHIPPPPSGPVGSSLIDRAALERLGHLKGRWRLYYREPNSPRRGLRLGVGLMQIDEIDVVGGLRLWFLENGIGMHSIGAPGTTELVGETDSRSQSYVFIGNFKQASETRESGKSKSLHLRFALDSNFSQSSTGSPNFTGPTELHLGVYTNQDVDLQVHAGTIVMQRCGDTENDIGITTPKDPVFRDLLPIVQYLEDKSLNFWRLARGIHSQEQLVTWLEERNKDEGKTIEAGHTFFRLPYTYQQDLLVLTPIGSFRERNAYVEYISAVRAMIEQAAPTFRALGMETVQLFADYLIEHLADEVQPEEYAYDLRAAPEVAMKSAFDAMRDARSYLFLTPTRLPSALNIEFGWALHLQRPTAFYFTAADSADVQPVAHRGSRGADRLFSLVYSPERAIAIDRVPVDLRRNSRGLFDLSRAPS